MRSVFGCYFALCACQIALATLSALSACRIPLVVERLLILAASRRSWDRDLPGSLEDSSMTILQEFHGAVLEVRNI